jgi:hypothetical protein
MPWFLLDKGTVNERGMQAIPALGKENGTGFEVMLHRS